jgi:hypothetical protein
MTGKQLVFVVMNQIKNEKKHAALVLNDGDSLCPQTKRLLFNTFKVWIVTTAKDDHFRLAGLELHTIYVDENFDLESDTVRYLLTRVRPRVGTGITILRSGEDECTCKKSTRDCRSD